MDQEIEIRIGHENFANYRRLAYTWWYALAEFVDNSTQSYLSNQDELDEALQAQKDPFTVTIATDEDLVRITDNALGMDHSDLRRALVVGVPPDNPTGRCRYGLGMKTAACWIGNNWKIITTRLGDGVEYTVHVSVDEIVGGNLRPKVDSRSVPHEDHYTFIEITSLNRRLRGRTIGKNKDYLKSIYRFDIAQGLLRLKYNDDVLTWDRHGDEAFLARRDGTIYKEDFIFEIDTVPPKVVEGWVGVLKKGSRSKAGFSILHRNRMIKGWPSSWRPEKVFGHGGRNDLINQRLVGEVNLEDFEVSHTKDAINWFGWEEEKVEEGLLGVCRPYMDTARKARRGEAPGHGPEPVHVDAAVKTLETELATSEFLEKLALEDALPPDEQIAVSNHHVVDNASGQDPSFVARIGEMTIRVFIDAIGSPNDPYVVNETRGERDVVVVINARHPHWSMLEGENSVVNYLRHCVYDGVAEHRAAQHRRLKSDTVKRIKDGYLRVAFEMLQSDPDEEQPPNDEDT